MNTPGPVASATTHRELLEALIKRTARAIDTASPRDLAALARRMLDLLDELAKLDAEESAAARDTEAADAARAAAEARAAEDHAAWLATLYD